MSEAYTRGGGGEVGRRGQGDGRTEYRGPLAACAGRVVECGRVQLLEVREGKEKGGHGADAPGGVEWQHLQEVRHVCGASNDVGVGIVFGDRPPATGRRSRERCWLHDACAFRAQTKYACFMWEGYITAHANGTQETPASRGAEAAQGE